MFSVVKSSARDMGELRFEQIVWNDDGKGNPLPIDKQTGRLIGSKKGFTTVSKDAFSHSFRPITASKLEVRNPNNVATVIAAPGTYGVGIHFDTSAGEPIVDFELVTVDTPSPLPWPWPSSSSSTTSPPVSAGPILSPPAANLATTKEFEIRVKQSFVGFVCDRSIHTITLRAEMVLHIIEMFAFRRSASNTTITAAATK